MNAIDLLKEDHDVVSSLFDQVKSTPDSKHRALFKKIKAELDTHAHIEETVFYPRLKKEGTGELVDITLEGIEEHRQVKMFLTELESAGRNKDIFEAKLKVLMEDVDHHVKEEEDEMFPLVEKQFSDAVLKRLGISLLNKKQKFVEANPDVAKNLANRAAMKKKGMLGNLVEAAVAAVEGFMDGASKSKKSNGKKAGNGQAKAAANGRSGSAKKTASKSAKDNRSQSKPKGAAKSSARGAASK